MIIQPFAELGSFELHGRAGERVRRRSHLLVAFLAEQIVNAANARPRG